MEVEDHITRENLRIREMLLALAPVGGVKPRAISLKMRKKLIAELHEHYVQSGDWEPTWLKEEATQ
jgi:hypothetical protein